MKAELLLLPSSSGHDTTVLSLPEPFFHRLGHRSGSMSGAGPRHAQRGGPRVGRRYRMPASAASSTALPVSSSLVLAPGAAPPASRVPPSFCSLEVVAAGERSGYRQPAVRRAWRQRWSCSMLSSARGARVLRRPHAGQGASAEGRSTPVALVPRTPWLPSPAPAGYRGRLPNQALKLTRLSPCLLGGRASAHNLAMPCTCISPAVQLNAGVRRPETGNVLP